MLDRRGFIKALTGAMAAASIAPASIIPLPQEELRALPVSASLVIPADCHFLIHDVNFMNIGKHVAAPRLRIFDELIIGGVPIQPQKNVDVYHAQAGADFRHVANWLTIPANWVVDADSLITLTGEPGIVCGMSGIRIRGLDEFRKNPQFVPDTDFYSYVLRTTL